MRKGQLICLTMNHGREIVGKVLSQSAEKVTLTYPCHLIRDEIWENTGGPSDEFLGEDYYLYDAAPTSHAHTMTLYKSAIAAETLVDAPNMKKMYKFEAERIENDFIDTDLSDEEAESRPAAKKISDSVTGRNDTVIDVDFTKR